MLLSFAMIVKNEEKNIERCLKAIKKLDGKLNYEIVIVDTGSIDKTIEIAQKYTDKVYVHEWNNDFADMRNKSIKYCKGDWIFILDADEVLEDYERVVNFFKNGESDKYNCAVIQFKNVISEDKDDILLGSLVRLFKNKKTFCYKGRVHEQPVIFAPVGYTNITLRHYGYSRESYELMQYKYERNLQLLLKDLKEGKDVIYTYFQLAQTYAMANKNNEALEAIKNAYKFAKIKDIKNYIYIIHFYARELVGRGNYDKAIELCDEALKYTDEHLDFYYIEMISYRELKNYKKQKEYIDKYFKLYNKINEGYLVKDISINCFSFVQYSNVLVEDVINAYHTKKYSNIMPLYKKIEKENDKERLVEVYLYSLIKDNKFDQVRKYFDAKHLDDGHITNLFNVMNTMFIEKTDNVEDMVKKLIGIDDRIDIYIKSKYLNKLDKNYDVVNFDDFYPWKSELAVRFYCEDEEFLDVLKCCTANNIKIYVNDMNKSYKCIENLMKFSERNFMSTEINTLHLLVNVEEMLLSNKSIDDKKFKSLIQRTLINRINYMKTIYNLPVINDKNAKILLNKHDYVMYYIYTAIQVCKDDKIKFIRKLKTILHSAPEYKKIIQYYLDSINDIGINDNMKSERCKLLKIIEQSIASNNIKQAQEIVIELEKLFQYDFEILNCDGIINYLNQQYENALLCLGISNLIVNDNFDTLYNIACVMEAMGRKKESLAYYKKAYKVCGDQQMKNEVLSIIKNMIEV